MADPSWLLRAHKEMGVTEVSGSDSSPHIMAYFKACGTSADWVKDDSTPWCGAFVGAIMAGDGYVLPSEPLRARAWLGWGTALDEPVPGCVVVISRGDDPASGHVGFFRQWNEDRTSIYLLGGNQGDCVSIAAFSANRVIGYRWPPNAPKSFGGDDPMMSEVSAAGKLAAGVGAVGGATNLPAPPVEQLTWLGSWRDAFGQVADVISFAGQHWMLIGAALTAWTAFRLWSLRKAEIVSGAFWKG